MTQTQKAILYRAKSLMQLGKARGAKQKADKLRQQLIKSNI